MFQNPLIIGEGGQLSNAFERLLPNAAQLGYGQLDLSETHLIKDKVAQVKPDIILNAAAYTAVDKAEEEPELAYKINAAAPEALALYAAENGIPLIHYSTDYVFDGSGQETRDESAPTNPLNVYGETKLAGEQAVLATGVKALIFRTSWVYDGSGKNFLNTMLRLGAERETLSIVNDQIGCPTYAPHLAEYSLQAAQKAQELEEYPTCVYHLCGAGKPTSWHGFAEAIFTAYEGELVVRSVTGIPSSDYPTPAKRPLNSRLDCSKAERVLGVAMPDWREGLTLALQERA
jgi:dTDP-4-dehydrorhamnose reductase